MAPPWRLGSSSSAGVDASYSFAQKWLVDRTF